MSLISEAMGQRSIRTNPDAAECKTGSDPSENRTLIREVVSCYCSLVLELEGNLGAIDPMKVLGEGAFVWRGLGPG